MHIRKVVVATMVSLGCFAAPAHSSCELDVSDYVGWTIVHSGTITGYVDSDGTESEEYEGCDFGRVLVIDYNIGVTCTEYSYSYAYMPDVVILMKGDSAIACINDEEVDVSVN